MVITESVIITKDTYVLPATGDSSVITITGSNVVVDFNGATLRGCDPATDPDQMLGLGIRIKTGANVTIKNLNIHGYKVALMADSVQGLVLENCDGSRNYRKRLLSNWRREDVSDWMSFHQNEKDEWLRYGAAFYMKNCNNASMRNCTVRNGQCALMLTRCNNAQVYNNNFSYNSAIGIGMYRCNNCTIMYNQLDFNVRGYSHGYYWRGQDSAGILVFEQCSNNIFAHNSVTHSGDGFFLWAGQTTMDTGGGGCNNNLLANNDFSFAPTNGIEATFSANHFVNNIVEGCDHGLWGGYSYASNISGNRFVKNRIGIAIEHGRDIAITGNAFDANKTAMRLWARAEQPDDWVYPKKVDVSSRRYCIGGNTFYGDSVVYDLNLVDSLRLDFSKAAFNKNKTILKRSGSNMTIDTIRGVDCSSGIANVPGLPLNGTWNKEFVKPQTLRSRAYIKMTEWGPYNFSQPWARLLRKEAGGKLMLELNGPQGMLWSLANKSGTTKLSSGSGKLPDTIAVAEDAQLLQLAFDAKKGKTKTRFTFSHFNPQAKWSIQFFRWRNADSLLNTPFDAQALKKVKPFKTDSITNPDYTWWGSVGPQLPADSFTTYATTTVQVPQGRYRLGVTADDIVRVWIDGKMVIDHWLKNTLAYDDEMYHETVMNLGGKHTISIQHAEMSGLAVLQFYLNLLDVIPKQ